jgi:hypothetical protein
MPMAVKTGKISLECFRQAKGFSSGFSIILKLIMANHIVLQGAHLAGKKSLLPSIQVNNKMSPVSTLGLL